MDEILTFSLDSRIFESLKDASAGALWEHTKINMIQRDVINLHKSLKLWAQSPLINLLALFLKILAINFVECTTFRRSTNRIDHGQHKEQRHKPGGEEETDTDVRQAVIEIGLDQVARSGHSAKI